MEYINVSSLVSDFWNLLFYPFIKISFIVYITKFILGKKRFNKLKSKLFDKLQTYSQKIKYQKRLGNAAPIVTIFFFFSFLYLFSMFSSTVESFISLSISFGSANNLSSETVLNVWEYHPYIENFSELQKVVYYKAQENELGSYSLLSTEGLRNLPELLLKSLIIFALIVLVLLIVYLPIKIFKHGFFSRILVVLRAVLVLLSLTSLLVGISFLNSNHINDYSTQAWSQYEAQLLSSGAPPESGIDIKKEKSDEVNKYINDNNNNDYTVSLGFGQKGISISHSNHSFEFHTVDYHY